MFIIELYIFLVYNKHVLRENCMQKNMNFKYAKTEEELKRDFGEFINIYDLKLSTLDEKTIKKLPEEIIIKNVINELSDNFKLFPKNFIGVRECSIEILLIMLLLKENDTYSDSILFNKLIEMGIPTKKALSTIDWLKNNQDTIYGEDKYIEKSKSPVKVKKIYK